MSDVKSVWAGYRKRRREFQITLVAYIPLIILTMAFAKDFSVGIFVGYGLLIVLPLGIRHIFFSCPNCGKSIHFKAFANFLGRACSHCGIRIGEPLNRK